MNPLAGYTIAIIFWAVAFVVIMRWEGDRPTEYINWANYAHAFADHTK